MRTLSGACLCGAVKFEVPDAFAYSAYCHCSECRRFSGSLFSAFAGLPVEQFTLLQGADALRRYHKSAETILAFCGTCGSSLYAEKPMRSMLHLRLGVLFDQPSLTPQRHSHVASKVPWYEIHDGLPQFDTTPQAKSQAD